MGIIRWIIQWILEHGDFVGSVIAGALIVIFKAMYQYWNDPATKKVDFKQFIRSFSTPTSFRSSLLIFILGVSVSFAAITIVYPDPIPEPEINITYTSDTANITENITGTAEYIPTGDEIWIFVHPHTVNKYYPQRSSAVIQNGEWSLSAGIGSESDASKKFDIIAVLADTKAQKELNTYFETCEETGEWPGMDKVPDSAKEYDRVTVIREPVTKNLDPEIQITYPVNGAKVGIKEFIKGTQKNIPDDKALWVVIFPYESYNYHPVKEVNIQDDGSDFTVPITIGTEENSGEMFDIIAVLTDKDAQEVFTNYLETAAEQQNWPGISSLPEGAEEMYKVTVTRK
ncbi:MAG: hypothetical protein PHF18_14430 [Methanosarcina sp.]|uniref:hypothetical protein n=1 Tax=Methanosarcina sp. TaxID=2213 RepID=UPI002636DA8B|nr:hypothetical protein [Methanosarcina sp.]MDD3248025.1 hypothetical protein [Methanosarcina sp.]MDD4247768.1 hypothetical protein [Methanosarcina sp.]